VQFFIDLAAKRNQGLEKRLRSGLDWLKKNSFLKLADKDQIALVTRAMTEQKQFFKDDEGPDNRRLYGSREGLTKDLEWNANTFLSESKAARIRSTRPDMQAQSHDVIIIGSGAAGGMGGVEPDETRRKCSGAPMRAKSFPGRNSGAMSSRGRAARAWIAATTRRRSRSALASNRTQRNRVNRSTSFACGAAAERRHMGPRVSALLGRRFAGPARDGWEIPWPIRYKDISPYYDRVEQ